MSLTSPKNNKGKKQPNHTKNNNQGSKFIQKPGKPGGFVKKQASTGSQRGS